MGGRGSRRLAGAAALLLGCAAAPARAQEVWARPGAYLGASGVFAAEDFSHAPHHVDDSLGATGRLGYRVNRWAAAELEGEWLAGFELPAGRRLEAGIWTLNAKGYPLDTPAQPFLMVGIGGMAAFTHGGGLNSARSGGFAARFGGGFDFYFSENVVVTLAASYVLPTGAIDDLRYTSFQWGLTYRFGGGEAGEDAEEGGKEPAEEAGEEPAEEGGKPPADEEGGA